MVYDSLILVQSDHLVLRCEKVVNSQRVALSGFFFDKVSVPSSLGASVF